VSVLALLSGQRIPAYIHHSLSDPVTNNLRGGRLQKLGGRFAHHLREVAPLFQQDALRLPIWRAPLFLGVVDSESAYLVFCDSPDPRTRVHFVDAPTPGYVGTAVAAQLAQHELGSAKLVIEIPLAVVDDASDSGDRFLRLAAVQYLEDLQKTQPTPSQYQAPNPMLFVAESRLTELRSLPSTIWDFSRLIRLCEELNIAYQHRCYHVVAMLVRAILDHVPPLFGKNNFAGVASNYGGRSFKDAMAHLDNGARATGDLHLHTQIRKRESLPTDRQVDFSQALDLLLSEIIRIST